jgi:hypothetical protein
MISLRGVEDHSGAVWNDRLSSGRPFWSCVDCGIIGLRAVEDNSGAVWNDRSESS